MKPRPYPATALTALAGIVVVITVMVASAALLVADPVQNDEPAVGAPTMAAVWQEPPSRPLALTGAAP